MVHRIKGIGEKGKPRGRPFKKGESTINTKHDDGVRKRMSKNNVLDDTRHETSVRGEDVEPKEASREQLLKYETLVDQIEFTDEQGNNLKLRFMRLSTRLYRMQVLLNDSVEIKPVTYSGSAMGNNYWNLLKGIING